MGTLSWTIGMGPKCNHTYPYETEAEGENTHRKGEGGVTVEPETGAIQLPAKEQQPPEARRGKIHPYSLWRDRGPGDT